MQSTGKNQPTVRERKIITIKLLNNQKQKKNNQKNPLQNDERTKINHTEPPTTVRFKQ